MSIVSSDEYQIDTNKNIYRRYYSILGFKYGEWKNCPKFEYVTIIKSKVRQRINNESATVQLHGERFLVNIFFDQNKHITFSMEENLKDALQAAEILCENLKIKILNIPKD